MRYFLTVRTPFMAFLSSLLFANARSLAEAIGNIVLYKTLKRNITPKYLHIKNKNCQTTLIQRTKIALNFLFIRLR